MSNSEQQPIQQPPITLPPPAYPSLEEPPSYEKSKIDPMVPQVPETTGPIIFTGSVPRHPCQMYCPFCKKDVMTRTEYENNGIVWIIALILFLFCCILTCIPFLTDEIKDVVHYCPECRREIARNQK